VSASEQTTFNLFLATLNSCPRPRSSTGTYDFSAATPMTTATGSTGLFGVVVATVAAALIAALAAKRS